MKSGEDEDTTYVLERMLERGDRESSLWALYRIRDDGDMTMLYGNRREGNSLKPPKRSWQVIQGEGHVLADVVCWWVCTGVVLAYPSLPSSSSHLSILSL